MTNANQVEAKYALRDKQIYAIILVDSNDGNTSLSPLYFGNDEAITREQAEEYKKEYEPAGYQVIILKQI